MNSNRLLTSVALGATLLAGCAATPAEQRVALRSTLQQASDLGSEISAWRHGVSLDAPTAVVETIRGFSARADQLRCSLDGEFDETATGVDVTGVRSALDRLVDFETAEFEAASVPARREVLDQFAGLARTIRTAAEQAGARIG